MQRISPIFPIATFATANMRKILDEFQSHDVLYVFVVQLTFDTKSKRRTIGDR